MWNLIRPRFAAPKYLIKPTMSLIQGPPYIFAPLFIFSKFSMISWNFPECSWNFQEMYYIPKNFLEIPMNISRKKCFVVVSKCSKKTNNKVLYVHLWTPELLNFDLNKTGLLIPEPMLWQLERSRFRIFEHFPTCFLIGSWG